MSPILIIARASVREHSRRKLIAFFAGLSILAMAALIYFILRQDKGGPILAATGALGTLAHLGFLGLLALVAALAVSMGNIGRPFSDGEAALVLARPVTRWQHALGRLTGSVAVIVGLCLLMAGEMQIVQLVSGEGMNSAIWAEWASRAFNLTLVAAIATLVSTGVAAPVLVATITFFIDRAVLWIARLYAITELGSLEGGLASVVRTAWFVTPKQLNSPFLLSRFGEAPEAPLRDFSLLENSPGLILWAVAYLAGIVLVTVLLVNRKEV